MPFLKILIAALIFCPILESHAKVTKESYEQALIQHKNWLSQEKWASYVRGNELSMLDIRGTIYSAFTRPGKSRGHNLYGKAELIFVLRSASRFVKEVMGETVKVPILRLNTDHPLVGEDISDAHRNGKNVDIAYPTINENGIERLDVEKLFWLIYGLYKSAKEFNGSGWIGTAYREEIIHFCESQRHEGIAVGCRELESAIGAANFERYHVSHLHFAVK